MLAAFDDAGIDIDALAAQLQEEGARAFVKSWNELLDTIAAEQRARRLRSPGRGELIRQAAARSAAAWEALERHHAEVAPRHLRELFAADPERGERADRRGAGLYLDYSKNRVTDETIALLAALAARVAASPSAARRCSAASTSTSPRTARCCTSRCGCRASAR